MIYNKKGENGITLVALVITIIVLLILAGISIVMLTGQNGILNRAVEAKEKTEIAEEKEKIEIAQMQAIMDGMNISNLQKALDQQFGTKIAIVSKNEDEIYKVKLENNLKEYRLTKNGAEEGIDWNNVMKNAKKPEEQKEERNLNTIGIGTDGKEVNMDLWEYTLTEEGYILNDIDDINDTNGEKETKGYLGEIIDGKIQGTVPEYIKAENDKKFIKVVGLKDTFMKIDDLEEMPIIPDTVENMQSTFSRCKNLKQIRMLPNSIVNMKWTFYECESIEKFEELPFYLENMEFTFEKCLNLNAGCDIPEYVKTMRGAYKGCKNLQEFNGEISESVISMENVFEGCSNLKKFESIIPNKVENMFACFSQCVNLKDINVAIPESVTDIRYMLGNCLNLTGTVEINANVTGKKIGNDVDYKACLGYGTATRENSQVYLKGNCKVLNEIISDAKKEYPNSNIILLEN